MRRKWPRPATITTSTHPSHTASPSSPRSSRGDFGFALSLLKKSVPRQEAMRVVFNARHLRRSAMLAMLNILLAQPALSETSVEIVSLFEPAGMARLLRPAGVPHPPLVILLPETLGDDGRGEAYEDSLLARGIATLTLGLGDGDDVTGAGLDRAVGRDGQAAARSWALESGFAHTNIGFIGFGLAGRRALAEADGAPVAALYPRCRDLAVSQAGPVLILQGALDALGCDALSGVLGSSLHLLPRAGHGWDVPAGSAPGAGALLPDPAGPGRLHAVFDLETTGIAAQILAEWFAERLRPQRAAP